jgi:voltage-gated potassium channel
LCRTLKIAGAVSFDESDPEDKSMSDEADVSTAERWSVLDGLEDWLEIPMLILSFVWFALVLAGLIWGEAGLIGTFGTVIWVIFVIEFLVRVAVAPEKAVFLRRNWITIISLVAPAFRLFRAVRFLRAGHALRGIRFVRVVGATNRGMMAIRSVMARRGLGYVVVLTVIINLIGAGGMLAFEPPAAQGGFSGYWDALWWTAMLLTTVGSAYWPQTAEGRLLCLLLSMYGLGVFGYITASFASLFIGLDTGSKPPAHGEPPRSG